MCSALAIETRYYTTRKERNGALVFYKILGSINACLRFRETGRCYLEGYECNAGCKFFRVLPFLIVFLSRPCNRCIFFTLMQWLGYNVLDGCSCSGRLTGLHEDEFSGVNIV